MEANNMKEMREALVAINCIDTRGLKRLLCELVEADIFDCGLINKTISAIEKARRALAAPPRNCDVGTPKEQRDRFDAFCTAHNDSADCHCPCDRKSGACHFIWAQLPYEEGGAK